MSNIEFHVIADEGMKFIAILGRTRFLMIDMKTRKGRTKVIPRSGREVVTGLKKQVQDGEQDRSSCMELLNELQSLCTVSVDQTGRKLDVEWSHLPH